MGKLLFIFLLSDGHLNVLKSIAKMLLYKYPEHEIYFAVDDNYSKKVKSTCSLFKPVLFKLEKDLEKEKEFLEKFEKAFYLTGKERYKENLNVIEVVLDEYIKNFKYFEEIIESVKPDAIICDQLFNLPFVENKQIPYGMVVSANPLYANSNLKHLPPAMSGLSVFSDKHLFEEYYELYKQSSLCKKRNQWYKDCNVKLEDENAWLITGSKYFNLFLYPKYCSYFKPNELTGKWFQCSSATIPDEIDAKLQPDSENKVKHPGKDLLTPEFLAKPGKLILFSMGTLVTIHENVIAKLLKVIEPLPHKFIVSGGPNFSKLNMPANTVGAPFLDQKELFPLLDIVITHGGNNTFTEIFYFNGKPFILVPSFGDQPDNAQRANDLGVGVGIQLCNLNTEILKDAIEKVSSKEMITKMEEGGKQSRECDGLEKFVDELHLYLKKEKK